jgi:hypothetical protein
MISSRSLLQSGLVLAAVCATAHAQAIPASIAGRWRIVRILPTHNVQCWDEDRAKTLLGTTLIYQAHAMVWQGGTASAGTASITEALSRTISRRKFRDEYTVDLEELGIHAEAITEIDLQHEDADITGATTEIPGDTIVLAGPGRIVVSACGVFYSAVRVLSKPAAAR